MSEAGEYVVPFYHRPEGQRYGNELKEVWLYKVLEGEVESHENCLGPDCDCWKKKDG